MIFNEANLGMEKDINNDIVKFKNNADIANIYTNEFVFNYGDNKFLVSLLGGSKRFFTGINTCFNGRSVVGVNFFSFVREAESQLFLNLYLFLRKELVFNDEGIHNPLFSTFGGCGLSVDDTPIGHMGLTADEIKEMNKLADKADSPEEKVKIMADYIKQHKKNMKYRIEEVKKTDYSYYPFLRKKYEKFALFLTDDYKYFEIKTDTNKFEQCMFMVKEFKNGKYQFKYKSIYQKSNTLFESNVIDRIPVDSIGKNDAAKNEYEIRKITESLKTTSEEFAPGDYLFVNKTNNFMFLRVNGKAVVVYPYGIKKIFAVPTIVQKINDVIVELSSVDKEGSIFGESNFSNLGGVHLFASDYVWDIAEAADEISILPKNVFQLGPLKIFNNSKTETIKLTKANDGSIVYNGYNIKFNNATLYYKKTDETDYKKANVIEDNGKYFFVDEDGNVIGERPLKNYINDIERHPSFIYQIDYIKRDGKLETGYVKAIDIYGYRAYKGTATASGDTTPIWCKTKVNFGPGYEYKLYELTKVYYDKGYKFKTYSDVTAKEETKSRKTKVGLGVYSETGVWLKGFSYSNGNIHQISGYPINKMQSLYKTSDYEDLYAMSLIWHINKNGNDYDIAIFESNKRNDLYRDPVSGCKCQKNESFYSNAYPDGNTMYFNVFYRKHSVFWDNTWNAVKVIPKTVVAAGFNTPNVDNIIPTSPVVSDVCMNIFMEVFPSYIEEYLFNYQGFSKIVEKPYYKIDNLGLLIFLTESMYIEDNFTEKVIIENNKRGIEYKTGNIKINVFLQKDTNIQLIVEVYQENKLILEYKIPYSSLFFKGGKFVSDRPLECNLYTEDGKTLKGDNIVFIPERFLNYLYSKGIKQFIVSQIDETEYIVNDEDVKVEFQEAPEGQFIKINYNGNISDVLSVPAAINSVFYDRPYLHYGDMFVKVKKEFLLKNLKKSNYSDESEFLHDFVNMVTSNDKEYRIEALSYVSATQGDFTPFKFNIDSKVVALFNDGVETQLPKRQKVEWLLELGKGNKAFIPNVVLRDNIYSIIKGICVKNCSSETEENIEYYFPIGNTILNRKININVEEQTAIFSSYFNNTKAQLIQDLREDTIQKRLDGAYVKVDYDLQKTYESIHTLSDMVWNIPTSFLCDGSDDETILNKIKNFDTNFTPFSDGVINSDDLCLQNGKMFVWINNPDDTDLIVNIKIDNTYFFNYDGLCYDFNTMKEKYNNGVLLYNDFISSEIVRDENSYLIKE